MEDHVFSCKRKDGSSTWKHAGYFFMLHDMAHYSVETVLSLKKGFFGMVAAGTNINDFDLPKEQRNFQLTEEAIFTEQLVNLVVIDHTQGRMENLVEILSSVHDENLKPDLLQLITEDKLEKIRNTYREMMIQWSNVPLNGFMQLSFEE